jgi:2-phosphosulfolactate phosphatase
MKILRQSCVQGAKEARGLTVIIDVFRAFSCEPLLFHYGVRRIILEADPDRAAALKRAHPEYILVGEVNEVPIQGGDFGNSPSEILLRGRDTFKDKIVVHRTTAGVVGASAAILRADEVLLGSFMTAKAIASYIKGKDPRLVTLVAMGERGKARSEEDEACADYLEHLLLGRPYDLIETLKRVVFQPSAQKFITGARPYLPREDPIFCLQRDIFDFVLAVERATEHLEVLKRG